MSTYSCLLTRAAVTGTGCIIAGLTDKNTTGQPYLNSNGATIIGLKGGIGGCLDFLAAGQLTNYPFQKMELGCKDTNGDGLLDFHAAASFAPNDGEYYYCPLQHPYHFKLYCFESIIHPPPSYDIVSVLFLNINRRGHNMFLYKFHTPEYIALPRNYFQVLEW